MRVHVKLLRKLLRKLLKELLKKLLRVFCFLFFKAVEQGVLRSFPIFQTVKKNETP